MVPHGAIYEPTRAHVGPDVPMWAHMGPIRSRFGPKTWNFPLERPREFFPFHVLLPTPRIPPPADGNHGGLLVMLSLTVVAYNPLSMISTHRYNDVAAILSFAGIIVLTVEVI